MNAAAHVDDARTAESLIHSELALFASLRRCCLYFFAFAVLAMIENRVLRKT